MVFGCWDWNGVGVHAAIARFGVRFAAIRRQLASNPGSSRAAIAEAAVRRGWCRGWHGPRLRAFDARRPSGCRRVIAGRRLQNQWLVSPRCVGRADETLQLDVALEAHTSLPVQKIAP